MNRTRAYRRHELARAKQRTRRVVRTWGVDTEELVQSHYRNRCKCSCPACGNPRRHFGLPTIQERRALDDR